MKLFSKVLESWKDEKAFEKRLAVGLARQRTDDLCPFAGQL